MRADVLVAATRRFVVLLGGVSALAVAVGLVVAAVGSASPSRAISLCFYGAGAFLLLGGFLLGNRGPYRADAHPSERPGGRRLRRASPDDMRESVNMAVLLSVLGLLLLAIGVIIDSRFELV